LKAFAVDFWIDPAAKDDPDRTDYGNDEEALRNLASTRKDDAGVLYGLWVLYKRVGSDAVSEMRNWKKLATGGQPQSK